MCMRAGAGEGEHLLLVPFHEFLNRFEHLLFRLDDSVGQEKILSHLPGIAFHCEPKLSLTVG